MDEGGKGGNMFKEEEMENELRERGWDVNMEKDESEKSFVGEFEKENVNVIRQEKIEGRNKVEILKKLW